MLSPAISSSSGIASRTLIFRPCFGFNSKHTEVCFYIRFCKTFRLFFYKLSKFSRYVPFSPSGPKILYGLLVDISILNLIQKLSFTDVEIVACVTSTTVWTGDDFSFANVIGLPDAIWIAKLISVLKKLP